MLLSQKKPLLAEEITSPPAALIFSAAPALQDLTFNFNFTGVFPVPNNLLYPNALRSME